MREELNRNELIEAMIIEKMISNPYDFLFRRNCESYPKGNHIALELPGLFKKAESSNIYTINGRALQQDIVESVLPDGKQIHFETVFDIEHMSYHIKPEKAETFYLYKNSTIKKHDKPCILYMITNIDYKSDEIICKINNETFSIRVIYIDMEKIDNILNTISKKDYSKVKFSDADFMRLIHCLVFTTKEEAHRVIERVIDLFIKLKNVMTDDHIMDMHLSLKIMIKYHYKNVDDLRRLLTMITEVMTDEQLRELSTAESKINRLKTQLDETQNAYNKIIKEKDMSYKKELEEKNKRIQELESMIGK